MGTTRFTHVPGHILTCRGVPRSRRRKRKEQSVALHHDPGERTPDTDRGSLHSICRVRRGHLCRPSEGEVSSADISHAYRASTTWCRTVALVPPQDDSSP